MKAQGGHEEGLRLGDVPHDERTTALPPPTPMVCAAHDWRHTRRYIEQLLDHGKGSAHC